MGTYYLSRSAQDDIDSITEYIASDNPKAALVVAKGIRKACQLIGDMPGIGRIDETVGAGEIFHFPVNKFPNYLVFYVIDSGHPVIVRVLHAKRDIPNLFARWYGAEKEVHGITPTTKKMRKKKP